MYFQTLDSKGKCVGYYADNKLIFDEVPHNAAKTWCYSPSLQNRDIEYARIYASGATLTEACPESFRPEWDEVVKKAGAYSKSFNIAKLNLNDVCIYDLVPEYFLYKFCKAKDQITKHVIENNIKPKNYNFMASLIQMLFDIGSHQMNIDIEPIMTKLVSVKGRNFIKKLQEINWICHYNPFGTVTGRLTTMPNTFPILTLPKEFRNCLHPTNDWFLELDYNAAEVRTLLGLSGVEQPSGDIHEWNIEHIYNNKISRPAAKQKIFEWLYSARPNKRAEQYYNKKLVKEKYWDGYNVTTEFDRCIKNVDDHHALNYIVQSTTSDLVLSRAIKIHNFLKNRGSRIAFMLHDSIIVDLKHDERHMIPELMSMFGDTDFGEYKVNVALGKSFGNIKKLNL